jgi:hypothetical protein
LDEAAVEGEMDEASLKAATRGICEATGERDDAEREEREGAT